MQEEDFYIRLENEMNELGQKINKLTSFITNVSSRETIGEIQFGYLRQQHQIMMNYLNILQLRYTTLKNE